MARCTLRIDEMEIQFKKDSWAWIAGLQGAKEFNGKLGQIIKFRLMIWKKSPFCYTFYFDSLFYNNNCSMQNLYSNFFNKIRALTGISFSEALIVASNNPQYDKRLFMELPWKLQVQNMGSRTSSAHVLHLYFSW